MRILHKWQGRWAFFRVALLSRESTITRCSSWPIHYLWLNESERTMYFILLVLITLRGVTLRSVIVDVLFIERITESVCGFVSINNSFVKKNSYCLL